VRIGDHLEVGALERRRQERSRGAAAQPVALGELIAADALLGGAVEVLVVWVPRLERRLDPGVSQRLQRATVRHRQRAAHGVVGVRAALVVLRALEVRQDVLVAEDSASSLRRAASTQPAEPPPTTT
jgi:hypothetical protein